MFISAHEILPLYLTGAAVGPNLPVVPEIYEATRVSNINDLPLSFNFVLNTQTDWNQFDAQNQFQESQPPSKKRKVEPEDSQQPGPSKQPDN